MVIHEEKGSKESHKHKMRNIALSKLHQFSEVLKNIFRNRKPPSYLTISFVVMPVLRESCADKSAKWHWPPDTVHMTIPDAIASSVVVATEDEMSYCLCDPELREFGGKVRSCCRAHHEWRLLDAERGLEVSRAASEDSQEGLPKARTTEWQFETPVYHLHTHVCLSTSSATSSDTDQPARPRRRRRQRLRDRHGKHIIYLLPHSWALKGMKIEYMPDSNAIMEVYHM